MALEKNKTGSYTQVGPGTELFTIDLGVDVVAVIKYFYFSIDAGLNTAIVRITADAIPTLGGAGRFYASNGNVSSAVVVDNDRQVIISVDAADAHARYINVSLLQPAGQVFSYAMSYIEIPQVVPSPSASFSNDITQFQNVQNAQIFIAPANVATLIKSIYVTRTTGTPVAHKLFLNTEQYSDFETPIASGTVGFNMPIYLSPGDGLFIATDVLNASDNIVYVSYTTNT